MSSIVVSGDTSGAVTLSAPAVAGTVTVTLPSTSGVMAVGGGTITTLTTTSDITVNGLTVGRGGAGGAANTAYGASAIPIAPNSGVTAIGSNAGKLFNTASDTGQSTFVGYFAGASCVSGTDNTFIGGSAGTNTTGSKNTAVGSQALQLNTTASNNTAVGYQAGYKNTTGTRNTFLGVYTGFEVSTGQSNTYVGYASGPNGTASTGSYNTAIGDSSLYSNTTADRNTAVGYQAGYTNTTNIASTFVGYRAGYLSTGAQCTFVGDNAGQNSTGTLNGFFGQAAGYLVTSGAKNTILGSYTGNQGGLDIRTASNYIVLSDGDGNPRGYHNATGWTLSGFTKTADYFWSAGVGTAGGLYLGSAGSANGLISQGSGGTGTTTTYIGNAAITTVSDVRLKENIVGTQRNALNILDQLRVVDHTWNDPSDQCENNRNSRGTWMGLIAQEAQPVIPWLVNKPTADVDENGDPQYWHMDYGYAVPLLVKAIQELKAEVDSLKAQINGASA